MSSPTTDSIRNLRITLGVTQKEAAEVVHVTARAWQWWESGEREMPRATWELFVIKAGIHPIYKATPR